MPSPYKRILLKLSGEALMGDAGYGIDPVVESSRRPYTQCPCGEATAGSFPVWPIGRYKFPPSQYPGMVSSRIFSTE